VTAASATYFGLRPSRGLALSIVVAHGAAGAAVLVALRDPLGWTLAALLLGLGVAAAWDRALLRAPGSIRGIEIGVPDHIVLHRVRGPALNVRVGARRWVSAGLVAVPIAAPRGRVLLVTRGMLDADALRRLRIWALWGRLPGVAPLPRGPGTAQSECT